MQNLTQKEAESLLFDWAFWARPKQLPPPGDWFCWLLRSGRGFGKTRAGAEWVVACAKAEEGPIALVGQTKADVRDTMVEVGESAILNISPPWFRPHYEPSKRRLIWPNGVIAIIYSGDEPDQLRGPQHAKAWIDELAKFKYAQETWDNLELGLRLSKRPQVVVTTTPRPVNIMRKLLLDKGTIDVQGSTYENWSNLSESFIERVVSRYEGTRLGRQELKGELLEDVPGALWKRSDIKYKPAPDLTRIVVAIDPASTSDIDADETGIIAAGKGIDGQFYILADRSCRASPDGWARRTIQAYRDYRADRIIGEVNNGGEMVELTLRTITRSIPYKAVHASRGKQARAEPISALYEQGKVYHVEPFPDLEDQLCTWTPDSGDSPDRLDALVWALTELSETSEAAPVDSPILVRRPEFSGIRGRTF